MEMRIQIQRAAETLDRGHGSTTDIGVSLCPSLLAILGVDGTEKFRQKGADERPVTTYRHVSWRKGFK
jgi:hypothetical protein